MLKLDTTGFTVVASQVCAKVTILFNILEVVYLKRTNFRVYLFSRAKRNRISRVLIFTNGKFLKILRVFIFTSGKFLKTSSL